MEIIKKPIGISLSVLVIDAYALLMLVGFVGVGMSIGYICTNSICSYLLFGFYLILVAALFYSANRIQAQKLTGLTIYTILVPILSCISVLSSPRAYIFYLPVIVILLVPLIYLWSIRKQFN